MLFKYFDSSSAIALGDELANAFIAKISTSSVKDNKKFSAKALAALKQLDNIMVQQKPKTLLNTYTKAKLAHRFKWVLRDAGYDSSYIDELTNWLVMRLR